jgi:hypothetical protein
MQYSLLEGKRKPEHTPMFVFFNAEIGEDKVTAQGYAIINPVRPGSKLPLFVNGEIVAVIKIPELPTVFSLDEIILERMEMKA